MRTTIGIAVGCAALVAYFAIDAAGARRELSRAAVERDAVAHREAELSRRVEEASARAEQIARDLAQVQAEKDQLARDLTRSQTAGGRIASLDLGGSPAPRGSLSSVDAGPGIEVIRLFVPAAERSRSPYRATIRKSDGTRVWTGSGSPAATASRTISLLVPARLLAPGDYILSIAAARTPPSPDAGGEYAFRVRR